MERHIKNWLPFYIGYLGSTTAHELSILIKQPFEETFNELEKMVKREQVISKVVSGELVYSIKQEGYQVGD